jgi:hypothetical protein
LLSFVAHAGGPLNDVNDHAYPFSAVGATAADRLGNVYVAGRFQGKAHFSGATLTSAGQGDAFVAKYRPNGALVWVKRFGGAFDDQATGIAVDSARQAVYVTGTKGFAEDPQGNVSTQDFVWKLNAGSGTTLWKREGNGGGPSNGGAAIALDGLGNVYTTGVFSGTMNFGGQSLVGSLFNQDNGFLMKQTPSGKVVFLNRFGTTSGGPHDEAAGRAIAVDRSGTNIYVAGGFLGKIDFGTGGPSDVRTALGTSDLFVESSTRRACTSGLPRGGVRRPWRACPRPPAASPWTVSATPT